MRRKAKLPLWSTYFHQEPAASIEGRMAKKKEKVSVWVQTLLKMGFKLL